MKKILAVSVGLLLLGFAAEAPASSLAGFFGSETLIARTPFDRSLQNAGFFRPVVAGSAADQANLLDLFLQARSFRYVSDVPADRWQSPEETRRRNAGDCEDKAIWLYFRLKQAGFSDVRLVVGRFRAGDARMHAWVAVRDNGAVRILDPVMQKRIWTQGEFSESAYYVPVFSFDGTNRYGHVLLKSASL